MLLKINGPKSCFWQWDVDQQLIVEDAVCGEVHFCNGTTDTAPVCEIYERDGLRLVDVPNIFLQTANPLTAYLCAGGTLHQQTFPVVARNKPDGYVYTETEVKTWAALDGRIKQLEEAGEVDPAAVAAAVEAYMAEHPVEETDPTVPAWAKAKDKPSYTAAEVGALPDDTEIPVVPTKVSAFENDKGYLTEQDLSGYAKSEDIPTKPSDIGAQPAGNYATKAEIPTTLPNPHKLTFSGAVSAEYDGSEAVKVVIPQGGGGSGVGWKNVVDYTLTEGATEILVDADADGKPFSLAFASIGVYFPANPDNATAAVTFWLYCDSSSDNTLRLIGNLATTQTLDRHFTGYVAAYGNKVKALLTHDSTILGNPGVYNDEYFSRLRIYCKSADCFFPAGTRVLIAGIPADGGNGK